MRRGSSVRCSVSAIGERALFYFIAMLEPANLAHWRSKSYVSARACHMSANGSDNESEEAGTDPAVGSLCI